MDAAKLFYDNLCHVLVNELKFELNPYDRFVANKTINNKQCTIVFHVDDLKISHVDEEVVSSIIKDLSNRFGDIMPLSVSRGKVHGYMGMTFDYTTPGKLTITMYDYINSIIENAGELYKEGAGSATTAPDHLFDIREPNEGDNELLTKDEKEEYHTITA